MSTPFTTSCPRRLVHRSGLLIVSLFFFLLASPTARAELTVRDAKSPYGPSVPRAGFVQVASAGQAVVVAGAWKSFMHFVESSLNNRRRMLQFATLGMCLALYIMIWRR
jgi:hypothetical protein